MERARITVPEIIAMKTHGDKIAALTAYDYLMASLLDSIGMDIILVGDSGAMVFAGHETTLPITMAEQLYHCNSVRRGVKYALVVADMPFLSFQVNADDAVRNAGCFFKEAHVDAVKLEGGVEIAETVRRIVDVGMPVMGHLGLTPQSIHKFGNYKVQARTEESAQKLLDDALSLQDAGAFSIVLEKIPSELAKNVTQTVKIPTIGIGAGPYCDGQILVTQDMLGLYEKFRPKFVRLYAHLAEEIRRAGSEYVHDVKVGKFPDSTESY
jgi:3-methyl-2-oxobutanoate hydroxymethyltransferase